MGRLNRRPHVSAAADRMDRQVSQLLTLFPGGGCLLINKALELKQQITKDPCIDPGYFRACLEFYESNAVERVAEKVFENGGYYPTIHHSDRISQLNHALKVLATEIFPDCNVSYLREKLLQHQHSHVEKVTDELLLEARWPERLEFGKLDRADYIKSESYKSHALNQLSLDYPQVWKSSIKAVLAENNWDYVKSFDQLAEMGSGGLWMTLCNFFRHWSLPKPGPSTAPAPDADFDNDLDILRRRIFESQSIEDAQVAKEMNEAEYAKHDQLITCDCCYGDYPFEELCFCSEAEHTFCHSCINNLLSEGLFGQGSLRGAARIACISMDGCNGCLSTQILEKVLPKDIWTAYEKSLFEESVLRAGLTIVQCASCGYCEVDESTKPLHSATNSIKFLVLVAKWLMWDLQSDLQTAYERLIRERRGSVFRCRRPGCQQLTCLQCHQIVRGLHKCYEKEQDGLRLYVEKAMADAVKRTCPVCNLSFQKADGCNKIVCRCGYTMCYVCRKDIRKESYAHFCHHFREVPGRPCDQCKKCDLYKTDPEDEAVKKAAARAKREYLLAHPEVVQPAQHTNTIVIGPLTTLEKLDGWRREAVLWVLQHGLRLIV